MRRKLPGSWTGIGAWRLLGASGVWVSLAAAVQFAIAAQEAPSAGVASWYGEAHRGRPMANGKPFDPDRRTAASWFYPLGTKVRVTLTSSNQPPHSVVVMITDRGPAWRFVRAGRIIDLSGTAFRQLADPGLGLVKVSIETVETPLRLQAER